MAAAIRPFRGRRVRPRARRVRRALEGHRRRGPRGAPRRGAGRPPAARRRDGPRALGTRRAAQLGARRRVSHVAGAGPVVRPAAPAAAVRRAAAVRSRAGARGHLAAAVEQAVANLERAGVATLARVAAGRPARHRRAPRALNLRGGAADGCRDRDRAPRRAARCERRPRAIPGMARCVRRQAGPDVIVGREAFTWDLRHVALVTHDPEELVRAAMQDYRRSVVAEAATRTRYREVPEAPLAPSATAESNAEAAARVRGAGVLRGIRPAEPARLAAAPAGSRPRPPTSSPSRSSA